MPDRVASSSGTGHDAAWEAWPAQWPEWTRQYEETAERLHGLGDFIAADDMATLVAGLVQYEIDLAAALKGDERDA